MARASDSPLVLVVGELEAQPRERVCLPLAYARALAAAGALPLILPPLSDPSGVRNALGRADGVLFAGADDFDTTALGQGPVHPRAKPVPPAKQSFDLALAQRVVEQGIPTLGICYGMQLLGLACGARLIQHLPDQRPVPSSHSEGVRHRVAVRTGTKLRRAVGIAEIEVISRHHQALGDPGTGWTVAARALDGTIEAIERPGAGWALGVQWHPELEGPGTTGALLLGAFVEQARRFLATRRRLQGVAG